MVRHCTARQAGRFLGREADLWTDGGRQTDSLTDRDGLQTNKEEDRLKL